MNNLENTQFLEITYNGEKIALSPEDATMLSQKGMNYDKLYEKNKKLSKELEEAKKINKRFENIAKNLGISSEDMLKGLEEEKEKSDIFEFSKETNLPYEYAKKIKEMEGEIKALKKEKAELIPVKKKNDELLAFKKVYPDVDERKLDPEILRLWEETERPLLDIYNEVILRKLLNEKNVKKANEENLNSSTGSALGIPEREEEYTDEIVRNMSDKDFNRNFAKILKQYKKGDR